MHCKLYNARETLLYEFNKGHTEALACDNIRQVHGENATDNRTCLHNFGNSGKETKAVNIKQGVDVLHSLENKL